MKIRQIILGMAMVVTPFSVPGQDSKEALNAQLWEAARNGDVVAVTAALDKGADVNAKFRYGTTALFKAAERGHTEVVRVLLARGAAVNVKDTFYGATAMSWALDKKHFEVVALLLQKDGEAVDDVLTTGAREGSVELVRMALERGGAKPESLTVALVASLNDEKKAEITEMLKKAGAAPPLEVATNILQSYVGRYKGDPGPEIAITLKDGKLTATSVQGTFSLMALDKFTFKPTDFDGVSVTFNVEDGKVIGFTLKQGNNSTQLKRVEETKPH